MNIVLLRGLIREKRHWGDFASKVAKAMPQARVITPEIPGVGEYYKSTTPANFDEMIKFMREKHLNELKGQTNVVFAISLGGMIAKRWNEMYPEDFQKLVLVNTSFKGLNPLLKRLRVPSLLTFLKLFVTPGVSAREKIILDMVSNNKTRHGEIVKEWIEIQNEAPVSRKSSVNQIRAALSFDPSLKKPEADLLILAAKKDRLCSYECSKKLNEVWGGRLELHPDAGHDLPIDDPEWLIERLKEFCAQDSSHSYSS